MYSRHTEMNFTSRYSTAVHVLLCRVLLYCTPTYIAKGTIYRTYANQRLQRRSSPITGINANQRRRVGGSHSLPTSTAVRSLHFKLISRTRSSNGQVRSLRAPILSNSNTYVLLTLIQRPGFFSNQTEGQTRSKTQHHRLRGWAFQGKSLTAVCKTSLVSIIVAMFR